MEGIILRFYKLQWHHQWCGSTQLHQWLRCDVITVVFYVGALVQNCIKIGLPIGAG